MSTSIEDMKGGSSSCCGAQVYTDLGICSDCKEHCDIVEDEDEETQPDDARDDALSDAEGRN